jgi:Fe-S cluster assembly ATP-binding protein
MLEIKDLRCSVGGREILKGLNLHVKHGEVHAIMGPNGAGKSTLIHTLAGRDGYFIKEGTVSFDGADLAAMSIDERAKAGLFVAFQYPVEIPGVSIMSFVKAALNAVRAAREEPILDQSQVFRMVMEYLGYTNFGTDMMQRCVNQDFSGGEKKMFEILQMLLLEPRLVILDEIDSGLDIDAMKVVAAAINSARCSTRSFLLITHYQRLLDYVKPDVVHILSDGQIVKSGGPELAKTLETEGYDSFGIGDDEA